MKTATIFANQGKALPPRRAVRSWVAAGVAVLIGITLDMAICRAQPPGDDVPGAEVLTRGPVHEAFAGMVTFNPEPGVVVTKAPPEVIEEVPPEERPEGDNVTWIPGYWAWDDERNDFLWISGTWRALPPGREWMAGYWGQTPQGHQWISGYWADATARDTTYLPPPPATVEVGPNIAAPSADYGWSPGCWIWYQERYAWRPGYWVSGRADWDWMPAHYVWTPRGYIFVGGYWDYPVARRGVLFAPVYFESGVYARRGYHYSPTIVINLAVFDDHLFLRPRYHHYYFGDYYATSYHQSGFYASFSFHSGHHGYDPIYSHRRWEHRRDREWEHRVETSYNYRRDHETARPPRTWVAQRNISPATAESKQNPVLVATPIDQLAKRKDSGIRFQPVASAERQQLTQRGREVQESRNQRRTLEAKAAAPATPTSGEAFAPAKVQLPRSPIVARPANQLGRKQTPPKPQQSPEPDLKFQPKPETTGRQPVKNRSDPQPQSRPSAPEKKSTPERREAVPRERPVQPESQPRPKESGARGQEEPPRNPRAVEPKAQQESERRAKDAVPAQEDAQRNTRGLEKKVQPESPPRAPELPKQPQRESQRNERLEPKSPQVSESRTMERPEASNRGATRLRENDRRKEGKGKP